MYLTALLFGAYRFSMWLWICAQEKPSVTHTVRCCRLKTGSRVYTTRLCSGYLTLEDDTLMQWCVDNDFCGEAAKAVRYDSDFVWEGESWPEGAYIISEKDKSAKSLQELAQCGLIKA